MSAFKVQDGAGHRLDEIYTYTRRTWGPAQADKYIRGLFDKFKAIAARQVPWHPIPAEFGVEGFLCRHEKHVVYWKLLDDGSVGIVTILHERMHRLDHFKDDLTP